MEKYLFFMVELVGDFFIAAAIVVTASCIYAILHGMYVDFKNRLAVIRVLRAAIKPISQELDNGKN